jgi:hypothetical protein
MGNYRLLALYQQTKLNSQSKQRLDRTRKAGPKVNAKKRGKVFYVELTFPFGIKEQAKEGNME